MSEDVIPFLVVTLFRPPKYHLTFWLHELMEEQKRDQIVGQVNGWFGCTCMYVSVVYTGAYM